MSLPTTKPAQLSIRSFFSSKSPKYAPPPSAAKVQAAPPPPPPPGALAPPQAVEPPSEAAPPIPPLPASLILPKEADIRLIAADDLNALRRINALLLPVSYPDSFYQHAADPVSGRFSRVITWAHDGAKPKVVGGVVCRVEPAVPGAGEAVQVPQALYIRSLCLLSPYRSMGLVNAALDHIIATAIADPNLNIKEVTAHVWTENEGLKWYEGREFERDGQPINGYYLKLRPDSAWFVRRPISASVRSSLPSSTSSSELAGPPRTVPASATAAIVNLPPMGAPPKAGATTRPPPRAGKSYQNQGPGMEWNDLPEDMAPGKRAPPPRKDVSETASSASSRSSSAARKKRDRSYPAAAFGN